MASGRQANLVIYADPRDVTGTLGGAKLEIPGSRQ